MCLLVRDSPLPAAFSRSGPNVSSGRFPCSDCQTPRSTSTFLYFCSYPYPRALFPSGLVSGTPSLSRPPFPSGSVGGISLDRLRTLCAPSLGPGALACGVPAGAEHLPAPPWEPSVWKFQGGPHSKTPTQTLTRSYSCSGFQGCWRPPGCGCHGWTSALASILGGGALVRGGIGAVPSVQAPGSPQKARRGRQVGDSPGEAPGLLSKGVLGWGDMGCRVSACCSV